MIKTRAQKSKSTNHARMLEYTQHRIGKFINRHDDSISFYIFHPKSAKPVRFCPCCFSNETILFILNSLWHSKWELVLNKSSSLLFYSNKLLTIIRIDWALYSYSFCCCYCNLFIVIKHLFNAHSCFYSYYYSLFIFLSSCLEFILLEILIIA